MVSEGDIFKKNLERKCSVTKLTAKNTMVKVTIMFMTKTNPL